jgi:hypothetical protein
VRRLGDWCEIVRQLKNELLAGQSPADKSVSTDTQDIVGIRHQAMTDEKLAVMNFNVCKLAIVL